MQNYYDEILEEIQNLLHAKRYEEAKALIEKELSMPYIPCEVEEKLKQLFRDYRYESSEKKGIVQKDIDEFLDGLKGDAQQQLLSVQALSKLNLRQYIDEIQQYLMHNPFPEAAALLVESIGEQCIQEEFVWIKDGVEYTFYGDSVIPCAKSQGYLEARKYLKQWLDKNIDMYTMAHMILVHEVFMFLPLSYEAEDALSLAYDVVEEICHMMHREDLLQQIQMQIGFHKTDTKS